MTEIHRFYSVLMVVQSITFITIFALASCDRIPEPAPVFTEYDHVHGF